MKNNQITIQQCLTMARELQENYKWQLMTDEELSQRVMARLNSGAELQPMTIAVYVGQAIHPAFTGTQGVSRRDQATRELANYLHRILYKKWPDLIESSADLIQATMERILTKIKACQKPETLLAFAAGKLRTEVQKKFRELKREQQAVSPDRLEEQGQELPTPGVESRLSIEMIQGQIRHYQQRHPTAAEQLEAVYLRYCEGLTVKETAERLETSRRNVSVLANRGRKFLRERKDDFIF